MGVFISLAEATITLETIFNEVLLANRNAAIIRVKNDAITKKHVNIFVDSDFEPFGKLLAEFLTQQCILRSYERVVHKDCRDQVSIFLFLNENGLGVVGWCKPVAKRASGTVRPYENNTK